MKPQTEKHLKNLKNPEYALKHKAKMIKETEKELAYAIKHPEYSGIPINKELHEHNIETIRHNLEVTRNASPENITWY